MLNARFFEIAAPFDDPQMGTGAAAALLYALIQMRRPQRVLEIGAGLTTLYLATALNEVAAATQTSAPVFDSVDNFSEASFTQAQLQAALNSLPSHFQVTVHARDFREFLAHRATESARPYDLIWFDCGGPQDYADLLRLAWPQLSPAHGLLALHYTYAPLDIVTTGPPECVSLPAPLLNALRRRQLQTGTHADFEVLTVTEPHKWHQTGVSLIRRLGPSECIRDVGYDADCLAFYGRSSSRLQWP